MGASSIQQIDLYRLIIPVEILEDFEVINITELVDLVNIELLEKVTKRPKVSQEIVQNGFLNYIELHHFSLQGKACYLRLRRRRWKDKITGKFSYFNAYNYVFEGTKCTKKFGSFLKGVG